MLSGIVRLSICIAAFSLTFAAAHTAIAADYPVRPIRIIIPYTPGGAVDLMTRIIGERLSASLGQPVVPENRPGAGASVGSEVVAKAAPDGYTLLACTNGAMTINVGLYKNLPYNPLRDFQPVSLLANHAVVLIVNGDSGLKSLPELVALAKSRPGSISGGSSGNGSTMHLALAFMNKSAGLNITHVPYRGSAPATAAVASGELQMSFMDIVPALPFAKSGKVRIIGVVGGERTAIAPEVPTMEEGGLKGFDFVTWSGIFAPAGTPKDVVDRLNQEIRRILADPDVKRRLIGLGGEPLGGPPEALGERVRRELPMWTSLVQDAGAKAD
jgi:tripartite-type tricarboxylate transporter receptor subunit TctC